MLNDTQKTQIENLAAETAQQFVDEFNEPLDSSTTDWDAVAWGEDMRKLSFREELKADSDLYNEAWDLYRETLEAKTAELCE